jgi:microcystin-dependent protein
MPSIDKWLTPNLPVTPARCRRLLFPDGIDWLSIVSGALLALTKSYSFEQFGTATPQQTADIFAAMFDDFTFQEAGGCRLIGEIILYAGMSSPNASWLECNGTSLLRSAFPDLFSAIGTVYGAVDGTHFNLPDLRGRAVVDGGAGPGLTPRAVGDVFGEENHQLTVSELASHTHTTGNSLILGTSAPPPLDALGPNPLPAFTGSSGNDVPHNTIQPSLAMLYLIVALP